MPRSVVIDDPSLNSPFDEPTRHFQPGPVKRYDNAYARNGVASLFLAFGPLAGWRRVAATDTRARGDRAHFIRDLLDGRCKAAEKVVLVMDQLGTHWVARLYEVFDPAEARRPAERLEARLTPEHGSSTPARTPKQRPRRRQALPANRKRRLHTRDRTKGIIRPGRPSSESRRRTGGARSGAVRRGLGRSGGDNRTEARRKRPGNPGLSSGDMCRHIRPVRPTGVEPVTCGSEDRCSIQLSYGRDAIIIHSPTENGRPVSGRPSHASEFGWLIVFRDRPGPRCRACRAAGGGNRPPGSTGPGMSSRAGRTATRCGPCPSARSPASRRPHSCPACR
jgi:hypothetical protein